MAWGGIASIQLALPAVWTAWRARGGSLVDVVRWMAGAPAQLLGLTTKGSITAGAIADLAVFAPDEETVFDCQALYHRNPVTPYQGRVLKGRVRATYLAGEVIDFATARGGVVTRPGLNKP
jgi:allantoinase